MENKIDIACLQETRHEDEASLEIKGYQAFSVDSIITGAKRGALRAKGLVTYVRSSIPAQRSWTLDIGPKGQSLNVSLHESKGNVLIHIANLYSPGGSLRINRNQLSNIRDPLILAGDLNAVHLQLSNNNVSYPNVNGNELVRYLSSEECVLGIINGPEPTHTYGNKLDYIGLINGNDIEHQCEIIDTLTSNHYAILTTLQFRVGVNAQIPPRKRLSIPAKHKDRVIELMEMWHDNYKPATTHDYNDDMVQHLESCIKEAAGKKGQRTQQTELSRWYNSDEAVKRIKKQFAKAKKRWQADPTDEKHTIFKRLSKQVEDVMKKSRDKYWEKFLQGINHNTPPQEVARRMRIAQGKKNPVVLHINPSARANELIDEWALVSSYDSLPIKVRRAVEKRNKQRLNKIKAAIKKKGVCDNKPFTEEELRRGFKNGKSTAPGIDGITYSIIQVLSQIRGNPILKLYNMIWTGGPIPRAWKKSIIVPIPKPGKPGQFRPISLTSCLCKMFERLVLNRLQHIVGPKLENNLYGFIPGKSTQHCIHRVMSGMSNRYTVFVDLRGAFDKANHVALLGELCGMVDGTLLRIVKDFLEDRSSCVYFQGVYSNWKKMELGTPQGGVLSPMLFNILINAIGKLQRSKHCTTTVYADDIVIQGNGKKSIIRAIKLFSKMCNDIGMIIAPEKSKVIGVEGPNKLRLVLQGHQIEQVDHHRYLGIMMSKKCNGNAQLRCLKASLSPRLNLLAKVARGSMGATVPLVRKLYISMVRSVIDYSASSLYPLTKKKLQTLQVIQNQAARTILGCPTTVRIENLLAEANLLPIEHRVATMAIVQIMRSVTTKDDGTTVRRLMNTSTRVSTQWSRSIRQLLEGSAINKYTDVGEFGVKRAGPWDLVNAEVLMSDIQDKKSEVPASVWKQDYLQRLGTHRSETTIFYTDGSLHKDGRSGCGVVSYADDREVSRTSIRLSDHCSTTQCELLGLVTALKQAKNLDTDIIIVCDSLSALQSIQSKKPECALLSNRCNSLLATINKTGRRVTFLWVPSHCGVEGNEVADKLANKGARKEEVDYAFPPPVNILKESVGRDILQKYKDHLECMVRTVPSIAKYHQLSGFKAPNYVAIGLNSRQQQTTYSRIRLQYRYLWEVAKKGSVTAVTKCTICCQDDKHSLKHYLYECRELEALRRDCPPDTDMLEYCLDPKILSNVLTLFPRFACSR